MRQFKTFAIALAIMIGTNTFANTEPASKTKNVEKAELNELLNQKFIRIQNDIFAKVIFTLDENKQIKVNSVATRDHFMRKHLTRQLDNKILEGEEWEAGKTYILPVKIQAEN